MLRITIQDHAESPVIKLEGKLVGPWVLELRRIWRDLDPSRDWNRLRLDVRGLTFVDGEGQQLLREIYEETNADFLADSPLTNYFADVATQRSAVVSKGA